MSVVLVLLQPRYIGGGDFPPPVSPVPGWGGFTESIKRFRRLPLPPGPAGHAADLHGAARRIDGVLRAEGWVQLRCSNPSSQAWSRGRATPGSIPGTCGSSHIPALDHPPLSPSISSLFKWKQGTSVRWSCPDLQTDVSLPGPSLCSGSSQGGSGRLLPLP